MGNQDGTVAFRTLWSNDEGILRDGLEAVVQGRNAGERQPHLVPMVKAMGSMDEVLGLAGQQARRDGRREVPPMYLMARPASLFRPLPPLGRGIAAILASLLGMLGLLAGARGMVARR